MPYGACKGLAGEAMGGVSAALREPGSSASDPEQRAREESCVINASRNVRAVPAAASSSSSARTDCALAGSRSNNRSVVTALGLVSATLREAGEASPSTPCRPSRSTGQLPRSGSTL